MPLDAWTVIDSLNWWEPARRASINVFSFAMFLESMKVCKGVLPKHHRLWCGRFVLSVAHGDSPEPLFFRART